MEIPVYSPDEIDAPKLQGEGLYLCRPRLAGTLPVFLTLCASTCLFAFILACTAIGQTPSPAGSKRVEVVVIAEDARGKPVTDLGRSDFTILDDGTQQEIRDFSLEAGQSPAAEQTPAAKNYFSNRLEQKPGVPSNVTIILLDALNTNFSDPDASRREIEYFLSKVKPDDRIAVFGLTDRLVILQDFTSAQQPLLSDLGSAPKETETTESDQLLAAGESREYMSLHQFLTAAGSIAQSYEDGIITADDRAIRTANALIEIADHVARIPGSKNLIGLCGTLPPAFDLFAAPSTAIASAPATPQQRYREDVLAAASRVLNDARLAVYPVQVKEKLQPDMTLKYGVTVVSGITVPAAPPKTYPAGTRPQFDSKALDELAQKTGGHSYSGDYVADFVRDTIDGSRVAYVLAYYPAPRLWNGEFHDIKVNVDRPGVKLLYRSGYLAIGDAPNAREQQVVSDDVIRSPVDSTMLQIGVLLTPDGAAGDRNLNAHIQVDSTGLTLSSEADSSTGAVDLTVREWDNRDNLLKNDAERIPITLTQEQFGAWRKSGLTYDMKVSVLPRASRIRFIVRDEGSGATGSLTVPVSSVLQSSDE